MAHLARLRVAAGVAVGLGGVVVIAGLGLPAGADVGVKRPVGQVDAVQRVRQRGVLELVGRKPAAAVPLADAVTDLAVADLEGQDALWRDGVAAFFVRDDGRRTAEVAALGHAPVDEDRNRTAVLALHFVALRPPAAPVLRVAQGLGQVLFEHGLAQFLAQLLAPRHHGAAIRAFQRLRAGIPFQVGAALRAGVLAHHGGRGRIRGCSVGRGGGVGHGRMATGRGKQRGHRAGRAAALRFTIGTARSGSAVQGGLSPGGIRPVRPAQCASWRRFCGP